MITCVSLNPSVDRTVVVPRFQYGQLNRASSVRSDAAGKAINVAACCALLGVETGCVGFLCRDNGRMFENRLLAAGVQGNFIWREGAVRVNIKLLDEAAGVVTEINENGEPVTPKMLSDLTDLVTDQAEISDYLILTGSLPPGCPKDYYATLIDAVSHLDCRCVLDADGEALRAGVARRPFLIKPNRAELEKETGRTLKSVPEVKDAALRFVEKGVSVVAVSLGAEGALITDGERTLFVGGMEVPVGSTVGAGDAMVAGLTAGFLGQKPLEEAFRMGVACATATVMTPGTEAMDKAQYRELLGRIQVERV